ncbi:hypothetical protein TSACC_215 [Terrimicrobium sacchariphilum]|uniref:Cytokinin riboside 5'-monophosphate phosphoribohydrolase n=1 Tax=Terrimicrobium sacchariphilum TaxID=690879 RepID=A0A146G1R5_TERSA|nr:TIGR00730 family Rossman fold protein [Terrimicrobium sacchariphilum]GAT31621.1 hypothetical protein TSACC_215 [Terrimicrobium sacchariphilum]
MTSLCVYCGSSFGISDAYAAAATELGTLCAQRGITIVYGGGGVGLMGLLADAALAAGGKVIGVIPYAMVAEERGHRGLTELIPVNTMHERKARMAELADAFVALPGGIGTLEEVIEAYTWLQLGLQIKPVALLNVGGFYDPLVSFLDHACGEGFLSPSHRDMLIAETECLPLLERLATARLVRVPKAIHRVDGSLPGL